MREIIVSEFKTTRDNWGNAMPYAIAFVYPRDDEPVVLKGMLPQVKAYIDAHFPISFYNISMWKDGKTRGSWRFANKYGYIFRRKNKWEVVLRDAEIKIKRFYFKRMPHRWIPEFDA